jgi:hypothetical protein
VVGTPPLVRVRHLRHVRKWPQFTHLQEAL